MNKDPKSLLDDLYPDQNGMDLEDFLTLAKTEKRRRSRKRAALSVGTAVIILTFFLKPSEPPALPVVEAKPVIEELSDDELLDLLSSNDSQHAILVGPPDQPQLIVFEKIRPENL